MTNYRAATKFGLKHNYHLKGIFHKVIKKFMLTLQRTVLNDHLKMLSYTHTYTHPVLAAAITGYNEIEVEIKYLLF